MEETTENVVTVTPEFELGVAVENSGESSIKEINNESPAQLTLVPIEQAGGASEPEDSTVSSHMISASNVETVAEDADGVGKLTENNITESNTKQEELEDMEVTATVTFVDDNESIVCEKVQNNIESDLQHSDSLSKYEEKETPVEMEQDQPIYWPYEFSKNFAVSACLATTDKDEFKGGYFKGCKWAPDGTCLLSNSDDNILRLYNLPQLIYQVQDWNDTQSIPEDDSWRPALIVREGGQVYDYTWFPCMQSSDHTSSCFLSTACNGPVHLWDAFTGSLRASYRAYNQFDEVTAAYSVAFDPLGGNIYCGFKQAIRIFNVSRPGRDCVVRELKHKYFPELNQKGIISCIAVNPMMNGLYACGSYHRTIGLYVEDGSVLCVLEGHLGGITSLAFSHDGTKLFSGGRKDSRLICWDMRNMGEEYHIFDRAVETNQRIYFDVTRNDRYLISGGTDGHVRLWDLKTPENKPVNIVSRSDCVNGVSVNPYVPILATAAGQRHFPDISEDMNSDEIFVDSVSKHNAEQNIKLWKLI